MENIFLRSTLVGKAVDKPEPENSGRTGKYVNLTPKAWAFASNTKIQFKVTQQAAIEAAIEWFAKLPPEVQQEAFKVDGDPFAKWRESVGAHGDTSASPLSPKMHVDVLILDRVAKQVAEAAADLKRRVEALMDDESPQSPPTGPMP